MNKSKDPFTLGEKVRVMFSDNDNKIFRIEAFTEDEFALSGAESNFTSLDPFPTKELIIAQSAYFDGKHLKTGDGIKLVNKEGKITEAYVAYILNKNNLVVSLKKDPSLSNLKWLIKMMSELYGS